MQVADTRCKGTGNAPRPPPIDSSSLNTTLDGQTSVWNGQSQFGLVNSTANTTLPMRSSAVVLDLHQAGLWSRVCLGVAVVYASVEWISI